MSTQLYQHGVIFQDNSNQTSASAGPNRNLIINGTMRIDQRNQGAYTDNIAGATYNTIDRFYTYGNVAGKFRTQQVAITGSSGIYEFNRCLQMLSLSAYTMPTQHRYTVSQKIALDYTQQLGWGTATPMGFNNGKAVTLSFWAKTSRTGDFSGSIQNAFNGTTITATSFPFMFTMTASGTWQKISIVIPPPDQYTTGWDQPVGMIVNFCMGATGTFAVANSAANTWTNSEVYYVNRSSGLPPIGVLNDNVSITGLQLEIGTAATDYEFTEEGTELAECQRYYRRTTASTRGYSTSTTGIMNTTINFSSMRSTPTASVIAGVRANATVSIVVTDESSAAHRVVSVAVGTTLAEGDVILLFAEL